MDGMEIKRTLEGFFREYGSHFTVEGVDCLRHGLLSPKVQEDAGKAEAEELGVGVRGRFRLMAAAGIEGLKKGAYLRAGYDRYYVDAAEEYAIGGVPICQKAVLRKCRRKKED